MKMQFVFGNPTKKSSFPKSGKAVKSTGKAKILLERLKVSKKKNPYNKPSESKKLKKLMYEDLKKKAKRSSAAQKGAVKRKLQAENKKLKKAVNDLEDFEIELLDSSIKEKNMAKKKPGKGKGKGKAKPKSSSTARKKAAKKAAATRKRNKKKVEAEKTVKKTVKKSSPRKRRGGKKGASKRSTKRVKKAASKKRSSGRKPKLKKRYVYQKGYKLSYKKVRHAKKGSRHYRKNKKGTVKYMWAKNPIGGAMSQLEKFTGMSMPEAGGLLVGGLAYGAVNSLLSKIPVVKTVHAQLIKVPVVGSALPTLLAGALLNWAGDKYKMKAASMLGKGLVGAAVVGMGVNASQLVPGLKGMSGVDLTMGEGQLGMNEADFGELIEYNQDALSGVDYTMNGVDFTMGEDSPADFGELIEMNEQALSGGQLG